MTAPDRRSAAVSSDRTIEDASREALHSSGSAVTAVLAGFFSACAEYPGVLLGPLSILLAGIGSGVRTFDGRLRQPGIGIKRPRGYLPDREIPMSARIATPTAVVAAVVANTYDGRPSLGPALRDAVSLASERGATVRSRLLASIEAMGPRATAEAMFAGPLLAIAGPSEGGLLTARDLSAIPKQVDLPASIHPEDPNWRWAPWADQPPSEPVEERGATEVVCAVDARGVFAAAVFEIPVGGVAIEDLQLTAPAAAVPVRRSVRRVEPGQPLFSPCPVAVRLEAGSPVEIVACPEVTHPTLDDLKRPSLSLRQDPQSRRVTISRR